MAYPAMRPKVTQTRIVLLLLPVVSMALITTLTPFICNFSKFANPVYCAESPAFYSIDEEKNSPVHLGMSPMFDPLLRILLLQILQGQCGIFPGCQQFLVMLLQVM